MRLAWLLVLACGAPATPPVANAVATRTVAIAAACPQSVDRFVWARELFPGCPPMPFANVGIACARDRDCPHPCKMSWHDGGDLILEVDVTYDAAGRWLDNTSTAGPGKPKLRPNNGRFCRRDGLRGTCELGDGTTTQAEMTVIYAGDRVVALHRPNDDSVYASFEYEGDRLVRERWLSSGEPETVTTAYDAAGRVATVTMASPDLRRVQRLSYDAHDRVTEVAVAGSADGTKFGTSTTYSYDDLGRPIRFVYKSESETVEDLVYDCR